MEGPLLKMQSQLLKPVEYTLSLGQDSLSMSDLVGRKIKIEYLGQIRDIYDGRVIKKSYAQGYSYKNFVTLARCDSCMVQPEKCHYHHGTCRESSWGEEHCLVDHIVYLSITSTVKVGVTRHTQVPIRWVDQGASKAIPLVTVRDRLTAGLIEVEMKGAFDDKTNWRKMLEGSAPDWDLLALREGVYEQFADLFDDYGVEEMDGGEVRIEYPVLRHPTPPIRSINLERDPVVEDRLYGIKGQYLIFSQGVLNVRNYQGYVVKLEVF